MERAQAYIVGTASFKRHEVADHVDNIGRVKNLLYGLPVNSVHINANLLNKSLLQKSPPHFYTLKYLASVFGILPTYFRGMKNSINQDIIYFETD